MQTVWRDALSPPRQCESATAREGGPKHDGLCDRGLLVLCGHYRVAMAIRQGSWPCSGDVMGNSGAGCGFDCLELPRQKRKSNWVLGSYSSHHAKNEEVPRAAGGQESRREQFGVDVGAGRAEGWGRAREFQQWNVRSQGQPSVPF